MDVLGLVPGPCGQGRWQVSVVGSSLPTQLTCQLCFREEQGSQPLGLGWHHSLEGWRNIYHISNQTYQRCPAFHNAQMLRVVTWPATSGITVTAFQTDGAIPELLTELLLVLGFLFCVGLCLRRVEGHIGFVCVCCMDVAFVFEV